MYTITKIAKEKPFIQLKGGNLDKETWFAVTDRVKGFLTGFSIGQEIDPSFTDGDDGKKVITFIPGAKKKEGGAKPPYKYGSSGTKKSYSSKTPEEQESIKRQAVLKATATMVSGIKELTKDNVSEIASFLYKEMYDLVSEKTETASSILIEETASDDTDFDGVPF